MHNTCCARSSYNAKYRPRRRRPARWLIIRNERRRAAALNSRLAGAAPVKLLIMKTGAERRVYSGVTRQWNWDTGEREREREREAHIDVFLGDEEEDDDDEDDGRVRVY